MIVSFGDKVPAKQQQQQQQALCVNYYSLTINKLISKNKKGVNVKSVTVIELLRILTMISYSLALCTPT